MSPLRRRIFSQVWEEALHSDSLKIGETRAELSIPSLSLNSSSPRHLFSLPGRPSTFLLFVVTVGGEKSVVTGLFRTKPSISFSHVDALGLLLVKQRAHPQQQRWLPIKAAAPTLWELKHGCFG